MIDYKATPILALQKRTQAARERKRLELEPQVEQALKAFAGAANEAAEEGRGGTTIEVPSDTIAALLATRLKALGFKAQAHRALVEGSWLEEGPGRAERSKAHT